VIAPEVVAPDPNPPKTRDELIAGVQGMVWAEVRKYTPPPGMTDEDLAAEANLALCRRIDEWDPERGQWTTFAGWVIKGAVSHALKAARAQKRGGGACVSSLDAGAPDGERAPLAADPRAADPAAIAEARELVAAPPRRKGQLSVRALQAALPGPCEVAAQVTRLRAAMFGAIRTEDVEQVMASVVAAAKGGDLKATKLLIDLLAPSRSGVTTVVNQQAVVVSRDDIT